MDWTFAERINIWFFVLIALIALFAPLPLRRRLWAIGIGAFGTAVCVLLTASPVLVSAAVSRELRRWVPTGLILVAYRQSGMLFADPWPRFQNMLMAWDRRILGRFYRGPEVIPVPHFWKLYLEVFYLFCYPLIPAALGVLILLNFQEKADEFWMIVLSSTYTCYALVPLLPALPPRLLNSGPKIEKRRSGIARALNEWILQYGSIQANTFPSAHVASCTAASLVLLRYDTFYGIVFLWCSVSIAAAVVIRRYHYLADAVFGLVLPIVLFFLFK